MAKKRRGSAEMDVEVATADRTVRDDSEAMDTTETVPSSVSGAGALRKVKQGRPMKRSKNARKMKAIAKAISKSEKCVEKKSKSESKTSRIKVAKSLYD